MQTGSFDNGQLFGAFGRVMHLAGNHFSPAKNAPSSRPANPFAADHSERSSFVASENLLCRPASRINCHNRPRSALHDFLSRRILIAKANASRIIVLPSCPPLSPPPFQPGARLARGSVPSKWLDYLAPDCPPRTCTDKYHVHEIADAPWPEPRGVMAPWRAPARTSKSLAALPS